MVDTVWSFLMDPANRDVITWIGGGFVVAVGGLWAVVKFFAKKDEVGGSAKSVSASGGSVATGGDIIGSPINIDSHDSTRR